MRTQHKLSIITIGVHGFSYAVGDFFRVLFLRGIFLNSPAVNGPKICAFVVGTFFLARTRY